MFKCLCNHPHSHVVPADTLHKENKCSYLDDLNPNDCHLKIKKQNK